MVLFYVNGYFAWMDVCASHVCLVSKDLRRYCGISSSYRWFSATMWLFEVELRPSSGRANNILVNREIFLVHQSFFFNKNYWFFFYYVCICVDCACERTCLWRNEEGVGCPGAGVIGGCEYLDVCGCRNVGMGEVEDK